MSKTMIETESNLSVVLITDDNQHVAINESMKRVLSLNNQYFRQLFYGWSVDSKQREIRVKDTDEHALRFIIDYIADNKCDFRSYDHITIGNILSLAHRLTIGPLIAKCVHALTNRLYHRNVFHIYTIAKFYALQCCGISVENYCLRFMANFANRVFECDEFVGLSCDQFSAIIDSIPHSKYELIIRDAVFTYINANNNNENCDSTTKLLSILSKRSNNDPLADSNLSSKCDIISLEKPISLIDFILYMGDEQIIVDNITFHCDRIRFGSIGHLFYLDIRTLEVSYDPSHCKVKLFIRIKRCVIAQTKYFANQFFTSNCATILFADPVSDVRRIVGQLFRFIDCRFIA